MLASFLNEKSASKCFFTHYSLPDYVNEKKPPTRQKPFSTVLSLAFAHTVDLILPDELYDLVQQKLEAQNLVLRYGRVHMSLLEILSGDFFNEYIKTGDVLMRSEGRNGIDHLFSLCGGVLRLEIDHATYERCGIVGRPIPNGGRKHVKSRWCIEQNLRLPSMVTGKPGFDRLKWACKNVLNSHIAWLFVDLNAQGEFAGPIRSFHPKLFTVNAQATTIVNVKAPFLNDKIDVANPANAEQLLEWLGMALLASPRIQLHDTIDPFLCRWREPDFTETQAMMGLDTSACNLRVLRWRGLVCSNFVTQLLLLAKDIVGHGWAGLSASGFDGRSYMILFKGSREALVWELPPSI